MYIIIVYLNYVNSFSLSDYKTHTHTHIPLPHLMKRADIEQFTIFK